MHKIFWSYFSLHQFLPKPFPLLPPNPPNFLLKKKKKQKTNKTKKSAKTKWNETKSPQKYYSVYFWLINNSWAWGLPCSVVDTSTLLENWFTLHQRVSTAESVLVSSESPVCFPLRAGTCTDPVHTAVSWVCVCRQSCCVWSHPPPLVHTVFPSSLQHKLLIHEGKGLVKTSHLLLSVSKSLTSVCCPVVDLSVKSHLLQEGALW